MASKEILIGRLDPKVPTPFQHQFATEASKKKTEELSEGDKVHAVFWVQGLGIGD